MNADSQPWRQEINYENPLKNIKKSVYVLQKLEKCWNLNNLITIFVVGKSGIPDWPLQVIPASFSQIGWKKCLGTLMGWSARIL